MLYEYLKENYIPGEPIFTGDIDIPGMTEENLRYHLKKLTDSGTICRFEPGVYYFPVMKWLLSRGKCKKFFPLNLDHICLLSDSIWKGSDLTVLGIWPLCYSWIGYLQANGPPGALLSKGVDHGFTCSHREVADNSNLEVITTLFRYCQIFLFCYWQKSALRCWFLLVYTTHYGQLPVRSVSRFCGAQHSWQAGGHDVSSCFLHLDMICHHPPDKAS